MAASIGYAPLTQQLNAKDVQKTCDIINRRHRMAELAGRDSSRLYTYIFFRGKTMTEPAYIMNIAENGFSILVPRYGIEGKVYISQPGVKNDWKFDLKARTLTSPDGSRTLNVLDRVMVKMVVDETKPHEPKLVFECTDPVITPITAAVATAPPASSSKKAKEQKKPASQDDAMDVAGPVTEAKQPNQKKRKSQEGGESKLAPPQAKNVKKN